MTEITEIALYCILISGILSQKNLIFNIEMYENVFSPIEVAIPFRSIFFMFHAENHKCVIIY